jgi:cytochrome c oxidase subunit 4
MSATTEHAEHAEHAAEAHEHHTPSDRYFIKIAIILAVVTALETSTYWWPKSLETVGVISLLIMMTIKFFMIVMVFMHLKFDSKIFSLMFYTGLVLAIWAAVAPLLAAWLFRWD